MYSLGWRAGELQPCSFLSSMHWQPGFVAHAAAHPHSYAGPWCFTNIRNACATIVHFVAMYEAALLQGHVLLTLTQDSRPCMYVAGVRR